MIFHSSHIIKNVLWLIFMVSIKYKKISHANSLSVLSVIVTSLKRFGGPFQT